MFCAFNNPLKIDGKAFSAWMEILRRLPDAVLWLTGGRGGSRLAALDAAAVRHGVDPARLVFARRLDDRAQHLARHRLATLYLDTFNFGGATSAMDAMLGGLPVLTRPGDQSYGRIGQSFLTVLRQPDMIATETQAYIDRAVALARDPAALNAIRQRLVHEVENGPLYDSALFAGHMEAAFEFAWNRFRKGEPASDIDL